VANLHAEASAFAAVTSPFVDPAVTHDESSVTTPTHTLITVTSRDATTHPRYRRPHIVPTPPTGAGTTIATAAKERLALKETTASTADFTANTAASTFPTADCSEQARL
jgi:hypothetical protein